MLAQLLRNETAPSVLHPNGSSPAAHLSPITKTRKATHLGPIWLQLNTLLRIFKRFVVLFRAQKCGAPVAVVHLIAWIKLNCLAIPIDCLEVASSSVGSVTFVLEIFSL